MSVFIDSFQTLCDRLISIATLLKEEKYFKKRSANVKGRATTSKDAEGGVYNFSEDIRAIRNIAERVELKIFTHSAFIEGVLRDMDDMAARLVALRLEAPNTMLVHKEEPYINQGESNGIKRGRPKTIKQPDFTEEGW